MNKREISEIKKQFKKDNNAITRICGCYVDAEKQIKTTLKEAFFALSEEEIADLERRANSAIERNCTIAHSVVDQALPASHTWTNERIN